jgi:hypothetical protein
MRMPDIEYRVVPSYPRYQAGSDGSIIGPSGRKLSQCTIPGGYKQVLVYTLGAPRATRRVHTLICEAFHGPRPSQRHWVAHWDGDPANNVPSNLRWSTPAENIADKIRHGRVTRTVGEINGQVKLTAAQVSEIRGRWGQTGQGESQKALAAEYGVAQPTISNIITRKTWAHI